MASKYPAPDPSGASQTPKTDMRGDPCLQAEPQSIREGVHATASDKCPWCKSKRFDIDPITCLFTCGSSRKVRSSECYEREIKRLRKALEKIAASFNAICATENELLIVACARQDIAIAALNHGKS